jgi:hypothetical protein
LPVVGFKVSGVQGIRLSLATSARNPKTGLNHLLPRAVMIASATFFGASL